MVTLVEEIFASFSVVMTGLADGLSEAFSRLIYVYGETGPTTEFNPLVLFIFTVAGISLGAGILWGMFKLIRGSSHRAG